MIKRGRECSILKIVVAILLQLCYSKKVTYYWWDNHGLFSFIFCLFKQTIQFLQQINVKKVMSIQYMALRFKPMTYET